MPHLEWTRYPPTVTHLYTLLLGGTVITSPGQPDVSAIAWAADTVIALGSDDNVRAASRGDSSSSISAARPSWRSI